MIPDLLDLILFVLFGISTLYILVFALFSLKKLADPEPTIVNAHKIAILIPAYREDKVIKDCVDSCLLQLYPKERFDVIVIADEMLPDTMTDLSALPIRLFAIHLEQRTKAKALNEAMRQLDNYDIALVLDADNVLESLFLQKINAAFNRGVTVVQAHRMAKNLNTKLAILDAVSEEINNSIFRRGHVNSGFSSALIGSGMAFEFNQFKATMSNIKAVGGFDKELELIYFKKGQKISYLQNAIILDEKIQKPADYSRQRRRWISAQFYYLSQFSSDVPRAINEKKWDFCDKVFQMALLPRVLLLGGLFLISVFWSFVDVSSSFKWWVLFCLLIISLLISIPRRLYKRNLLVALISLPYVFGLTIITMMKLKGANKEFIHTQHG